VDVTLGRELKKIPTFDAKGAEDVDTVGWWIDGDEVVVLAGAAFAAASSFHNLRVSTGGTEVFSGLTVGSIFHILNPHPVLACLVSASASVVSVGIGGSLTASDSIADGFISPMNSRKALAQVSDASRASMASVSSFRVSSSSTLSDFISRRRASSSSTTGSRGARSRDCGGELLLLNTENPRVLLPVSIDDDKSGIVMVWAFGLGEHGMSTDPERRNPESEIDEMRL